MPTRTPYTSTALEVLTSANLEKYPKGWYGYATSTSAQTGITTVETDVTGLSLSITLGANRLVEVFASVHALSSVDQDNLRLRLYRDATVVGSYNFELDTLTTTAQGMALDVGPSAGTYTYKATIVRVGGSGNIDTTASATSPNLLLVRDIGPSS